MHNNILAAGPSGISSAAPKSTQHSISSLRSGMSRHAPSSHHSASPAAQRGSIHDNVDVDEHRRRAAGSASSALSEKWWRIRLFHGMIHDLKRRAPYYWSDWADAWDYRIVPGTVYMYFAKYDSPSRISSLFVVSLFFVVIWTCHFEWRRLAPR